MIHGNEDQFVGIVAASLGLFILGASALNWSWYYSLGSARFLERRLGRDGARLCHALLAVGLIALGGALIRGLL